MEYLDLAAKLASAVDWRKVYPNPRVGCVIVQNGEVVATGVHERYGELHAEQKALAALFQTPNFKLQTSNKKLELYVTLEPCDDFQGKKTESCTQKLINLSPKKVFVGALDKRFGGKNVEKLRAAGIEVEVRENALCADLARTKPHIILKLAQTLDGRISYGGKKDIISSLESRKKAHQLRSEVDGILTTTQTLIADDPLLDCRLLTQNKVPPLYVFGCTDLPKDLQVFQQQRDIHCFSGENLAYDLREMSENGVKTVLTECGATFSTELLKQGLEDELLIFVTPRIAGRGILSATESLNFNNFSLISCEESGGDMFLKYRKKR